MKNTSRRQSVKAAQVQGLHNASTESSDSSESEEDTARKEEDEDDQTAVKEAMKKQLHSQGMLDLLLHLKINLLKREMIDKIDVCMYVQMYIINCKPAFFATTLFPD